MAELAEIAGCSVMTVSYALRNSPEVSEETRAKIQELAEKHGYRKNPFVSALMATRRSKRVGGLDVIALLTKFDTPMWEWKKRRPFYSELYEGMLERAAELGFRLDEFPMHGGDSPLNGRQLSRVLAARGIRGAILMPGGNIERDFPLEGFDYTNFTVIAAAFHERQMQVHRTASDYGRGIEVCIEEALRRGYIRIGLALNQSLDPGLRYAFSGRFLAWQTGRPKKNLVPLIAGKGDLVPREKFLAWFEKHRPDCILSPRPVVVDWLKEIGVRVPEDVGCIFVPVREHAELSGFDARTHEVGRATINLIARELFLNHSGLPGAPEVVLIGGRWQEGRTIRSQP